MNLVTYELLLLIKSVCFFLVIIYASVHLEVCKLFAFLLVDNRCPLFWFTPSTKC